MKFHCPGQDSNSDHHGEKPDMLTTTPLARNIIIMTNLLFITSLQMQQEEMKQIVKDARKISKSSTAKSEQRREAMKKIVKATSNADVMTKRKTIKRVNVLNKMECESKLNRILYMHVVFQVCVCMYASMYVMYVCIYICNACTYVCAYACIHLCMHHACMHASMQ